MANHCSSGHHSLSSACQPTCQQGRREGKDGGWQCHLPKAVMGIWAALLSAEISGGAAGGTATKVSMGLQSGCVPDALLVPLVTSSLLSVLEG